MSAARRLAFGLLVLMAWLAAGACVLAKEAPPHEKVEPLLPELKWQAGELLTLDECIVRGWSHPTLAVQKAKIAQQEAVVRQALALYLPSMGIFADKIFQDTPWDPPQQADANIGITGTIWDSFQRGEQLAAAREALRASVYDFHSTWVTQVDSIREAYYTVLLDELFLLIQEDDLSRTQMNAQAAAGFLRAGLKSMIDYTQAQVQVSQSKVAVIKARNTLRDARIALAQLIATDPRDVATRPVENLLVESPIIPEAKAARERLEQINPSLLAFEYQARAALAQARFQGRQWMPTITGTAYIGGSNAIFADMLSWQTSVNLNFPFYQPGIVPLMDQQKALASQFQSQKAATRLQLLQNLATAYVDFDGAAQRVVAGETEVRLSLMNQRLSTRRYAEGISEITELVNARSFLNSARTDYANALRDRRVAEAHLLQAIGEAPIPRNAKAPAAR